MSPASGVYTLFLGLAGAYAVLLPCLAVLLRRKHPPASERPTPQAPPGEGALPQITVLVAARNEEDNLPRLLDALLQQDWPADRLQIVVVDDRSEDGTAGVLAEAAARHPDRIEVVTVEELPGGIGPKKHALLRGLERARGTWICVTDADCTFDSGWLRALARHFAPETGMVVGPSLFKEPPGGYGPLTGASALEFASYSVASAAFIAVNFPVIASANNLAYRRSAFEAIGGFARHASVVNGDDDLLLQDLHHARDWNLAFAASPQAVVYTLPPKGMRGFWEQRKRWAGTCLHYRAGPKLFLGLVFLFYATILILLAAGAAGVSPRAGIIGLIGLGMKTAADWILLRTGLGLFGRSPLLRHFPLASLLHLPLVFAAVAVGSFGRSTWKGQKLGRKAKKS